MLRLYTCSVGGCWRQQELGMALPALVLTFWQGGASHFVFVPAASAKRLVWEVGRTGQG